MVVDVLGVSPKNVTVIHGDTQVGIAYGTGGSKARRSAALPTAPVYNAAGEVREKMRHIAAHLLEASSENLELENGAWAVRGVPGPSVTVTEMRFSLPCTGPAGHVSCRGFALRGGRTIVHVPS